MTKLIFCFPRAPYYRAVPTRLTLQPAAVGLKDSASTFEKIAEGEENDHEEESELDSSENEEGGDSADDERYSGERSESEEGENDNEAVQKEVRSQRVCLGITERHSA